MSLSFISKEIITKIANKALDKAIEVITADDKTDFKNYKNNLPELLETHLIELINWSADIPFIGLYKPKNVESSTIELGISSAIFKYDNLSDGNLITEDDLLSFHENVLLIGQPGAGKTTTLKRIILKYFLTGYENYKYDFPILIRIRDIDFGKNILVSIVDLFGIKYTIEVEEENNTQLNNFNSKTTKIIRKVGDVPLEIFVPKFLNEINALVLIDGLDEAAEGYEKAYLKEIENLGLKLNSSKIILTMRKSKLINVHSLFIKYELKALDNKKIKEISKKWLGKNKGFLLALKTKPYYDLCNRPIFLTLLMILYQKYNSLPFQSYEVYKEATYLILKDWDEHRGIIRKSIYSDFDTRKKMKFLYEISFYLTYKIKQKVFSTEILKSVYEKIHSKYNLPYEDMESVISEIESHNGLITVSGYNKYEFSHLSIQEYLCAEYLVTLPYSFSTIRYFYEYPEPIAIAISLSGEPSAWFANLLLNNKTNISHKGPKTEYLRSLFTLISRLLIELPSFNISEDLGAATLYLIDESSSTKEFLPLITSFLKINNVIESINKYLFGYCSLSSDENDILQLKRRIPISGDYYLAYPVEFKIPKSYFAKETNLIYIKNLKYIGTDGVTILAIENLSNLTKS